MLLNSFIISLVKFTSEINSIFFLLFFLLEQIFVTGDESLIDVLQPPENGEFYIDFYESFDENGTLIDCGLDGLCEFDEGYIDADYGEDDGIQNRYFQGQEEMFSMK